MHSKQDKVIAIHQPNVFPWLGYFDKILKAHTFVYLDHVVSNTSQSWIKRVQIMIQGEAHWLTVPLKRPHGNIFLPINEIEIQAPEQFTEKHLRTVRQSYCKAAYFSQVVPLVEEFYENKEVLIADRNISFIESVCKRLCIATPRVRSSALICTQQSTELLIEVTKRLGGTTYMCGGGAAGYQEDEKFPAAGVQLIYQNFCHPEYAQIGAEGFVGGLSIIDVLMNCGFEGTRGLLFGRNGDVGGVNHWHGVDHPASAGV
jgi:hypothetical protein